MSLRTTINQDKLILD